MTGLEKKSDVVSMAAYAPLLVNTNNRGWNPDMIVFDNHRQEEPLICTSSLGSNLTLKILYRHSAHERISGGSCCRGDSQMHLLGRLHCIHHS